MLIEIVIKIVDAGENGTEDEPSADNVVAFVRSIQGLPGVKVTVE